MLDNLFNGILVLSFLAMSAVNYVTTPTETEAVAAPQHVAQLERVVVNGHSVKS